MFISFGLVSGHLYAQRGVGFSNVVNPANPLIGWPECALAYVWPMAYIYL